jgi:AraC-like DNA-binding protein
MAASKLRARHHARRATGGKRMKDADRRRAPDSADLARADDLLSSSLRALHVSGTLLLRERYASPWAVTIPSAPVLGAMVHARAGTRVVAFHLVEFGHCELRCASGARQLLQAGEMMICFGGQAHRIGDGEPPRAQAVEALLAGEPNAQHPAVTGRPAAVSLICGVFLLEHAVLSPLLEALPALMHASLSRPGELNTLSGIARLMVDEMACGALGGSYVVERLLEVLCAQAVRAYLERAPRQESGWVRAIQDPVVGRAMHAIHAQPGLAWTVSRMARQVAMSPSRFSARFVEALGDSPMSYVAKLRMGLACKMLATSQANIEQIATEVGYESAAAFNRAFRSTLGLPPGAWRAKHIEQASDAAARPS